MSESVPIFSWQLACEENKTYQSNQFVEFQNPATKELKEPDLSFEIEPRSHYRVRFESKKESSHGELKGENSLSKISVDFPSVVVKNLDPSYDYIGLWEICAEDDKKILSFSLKAKKSVKQKVEHYIPTTSEGRLVGDKFEFALKNFYIYDSKNRSALLKEKDEVLKKFKFDCITKYLVKPTDVSKKVQQKYRLIFFLLYKHREDAEYKYKSICSKPIYNADACKILKLCNTRGNPGDEVTLLCLNVPKDGSKAHIFHERNEEIKWECIIDFTEITTNVGFTFKMPNEDQFYGLQEYIENDEVALFIKVLRGGNLKDATQKSRYFLEITQPRRKKARSNTNLQCNEVQTTQAMDFLDMIDSIAKLSQTDFVAESNTSLWVDSDAATSTKSKQANMSKYKMLKKVMDDSNEVDQLRNVLKYIEDFDTIAHDAIVDEQLPFLYELALSEKGRKLELGKLLSQLQDENLNTPLHEACELNEGVCILPLLRMGAILYAQNRARNTPLHIAILNNNVSCIKKFEKLFCKPNAYDNLADQLKELLQKYNRKNLTVLHLAVLKNQHALVTEILKFCKQFNLNANEFEVLGNGNTLLHLIAGTGNEHMAEIITDLLPESLNAKDYKGDRAFEKKFDQEKSNILNKIFENLQTHD